MNAGPAGKGGHKSSSNPASGGDTSTKILRVKENELTTTEASVKQDVGGKLAY